MAGQALVTLQVKFVPASSCAGRQALVYFGVLNSLAMMLLHTSPFVQVCMGGFVVVTGAPVPQAVPSTQVALGQITNVL